MPRYAPRERRLCHCVLSPKEAMHEKCEQIHLLFLIAGLCAFQTNETQGLFVVDKNRCGRMLRKERGVVKPGPSAFALVGGKHKRGLLVDTLIFLIRDFHFPSTVCIPQFFLFLHYSSFSLFHPHTTNKMLFRIRRSSDSVMYTIIWWLAFISCSKCRRLVSVWLVMH